MAKQRRTKTTGTIFQRAQDKLWVGGVELPKNKKTGQRKQKRVYASTRSGVESKLASIKTNRKRR
jgi:hypothetical protein